MVVAPQTGVESRAVAVHNTSERRNLKLGAGRRCSKDKAGELVEMFRKLVTVMLMAAMYHRVIPEQTHRVIVRVVRFSLSRHRKIRPPRTFTACNTLFRYQSDGGRHGIQFFNNYRPQFYFRNELSLYVLASFPEAENRCGAW